MAKSYLSALVLGAAFLWPMAATAGWLQVCNRGSVTLSFATYQPSFFGHAVNGFHSILPGRCWNRKYANNTVHSFAFVARSTAGPLVPLVFTPNIRGGRIPGRVSGFCVAMNGNAFAYKGSRPPTSSTTCKPHEQNIATSFTYRWGDGDWKINLGITQPEVDALVKGAPRPAPAPVAPNVGKGPLPKISEEYCAGLQGDMAKLCRRLIVPSDKPNPDAPTVPPRNGLTFG